MFNVIFFELQNQQPEERKWTICITEVFVRDMIFLLKYRRIINQKVSLGFLISASVLARL